MMGNVVVRLRNLESGTVYEHTMNVPLHPTGSCLGFRGYKEIAKEIGTIIGWEIEEGLYWDHKRYTMDDFRWGAILEDKRIAGEEMPDLEISVLTAMNKAWKMYINKEV